VTKLERDRWRLVDVAKPTLRVERARSGLPSLDGPT